MSFLRRSSIPNRIRHSELADALPRTELRQLDQTATVIDVKQGRQIIAESTMGRECFVVIDGEFDVTGPKVATTVGAGSVTGELALLTGRQRNASVVAASDATVYVLNPREFATLLSEAPAFCSQVVNTATGRLGSDRVRLPAQYVRHAKKTAPATTPWSRQLAEVPSWGRVL